MIRLLALTVAAIVAMLAMFRGTQFQPQRPVQVAQAEHLNPWRKDAPPLQRWHFVTAASPANPHHDTDATTITRDASGHFRITAEVNGQSSEFLVDTGADLVALTRDEAQRLGIFVSPSDFRPMLHTASGVAEGARIQIDRLDVGGTELHHVDAVVIEELGTNLLGQSALRQLGTVEQDGDHMSIVPG